MLGDNGEIETSWVNLSLDLILKRQLAVSNETSREGGRWPQGEISYGDFSLHKWDLMKVEFPG
jgi:hypothetical protein